MTDSNLKSNFKGDGFDFLLLQDSENLYDQIMSQHSAGDIKESDESGFFVELEAIHELITGNNVQFTSTELKGSKKKHTGKYSWNHPYDKPVLLNHDQYTGDPIGRVVDASFSKVTKSGIPGIKLKAKINNKDAIERIKDERYKTVSIGAHAERAHCSICNKDWVNEGWCEHRPGGEYEEGVMSLVVKDITFVEVSFVNIPADSHAGITDFYEKSPHLKESDNSSQVLFDQDKFPIKNTGGMNSDMKEKIKQLQESLKTKEERVEVLQETIKNRDKKIEKLSADNELLDEKKVVLEEKLENLEQEIIELNEANASLKEQHHEHLAKKVVALKKKMGKIKESNEEDYMEKIIKEHIERSEDSLNDSLKDLKFEKKLEEESYDPEDAKVQKEGLAQEETRKEIDADDEEDDAILDLL